MKFAIPMKLAGIAAAGAFALAIAAGCSSGTSNSGGGTEGSTAEATSAAVQATSPAVETSAAVQRQTSPAETSGPVQPAVTEESQIFEGTVVVGTAEDIIALQAIDIDPAVAGGGGTYAVLVFDQETPVTGMVADGTGPRTDPAKMIGIAEYTDYGSFVVEYGDLELFKELNGQHVMLAANADKIMFPTDVRIPIGEPSAKEVVLL